MTESLNSVLSIDTRDAIRLVEIDRKPVNALPTSAWIALAEAFREADEDTSIRSVVLHGQGGRFCAGADINELTNPDPDADRAKMLTVVEQAAHAIRSFRVPVIAAIDGPAHGGGLELALACDIRVASPRATFAAAGVNMGLIASVASLMEVAGDTVARRMLLTGDRVDATQAQAWDIVTEQSDDPFETAISLAERIAAKPPLAIEATKAALNGVTELSRSEHNAALKAAFRGLADSEDHGEALAAFLDKRAGEFHRS